MAEPDLDDPPTRPTAELPLRGMTVLVVEDSRFAAEALRLICLRAGARLRRAESLTHARRHLGLYTPDCLIVDCGLPDGDGCPLIAEMSHSAKRPTVILGLSGESSEKPRVMAAGADGFLGKPLPALPKILRLMRPRLLPHQTSGQVIAPHPDPVALGDDLRHALEMMGRTALIPRYVASFLSSIATQSGDMELAAAAAHYRDRPQDGRRLHVLLSKRLRETEGQANKPARALMMGTSMTGPQNKALPVHPRPEIAHLHPKQITPQHRALQ